MKMQNIVILSLFLFLCDSADLFCRGDRDEALLFYNRDWPIGNTRFMAGSAITRMSGENNVLATTNIKYLSLDSLINVVLNEEREMVSNAEQAQREIAMYNSKAKGGQIVLYIRRELATDCNLDLFSCVIKDQNDENVLFTKQFDRPTPKYSPEEGYEDSWRDFGFMDVNVDIPATFYVYIIDKRFRKSYKFKVVRYGS
jgi:hypothetical protein